MWSSLQTLILSSHWQTTKLKIPGNVISIKKMLWVQPYCNINTTGGQSKLYANFRCAPGWSEYIESYPKHNSPQHLTVMMAKCNFGNLGLFGLDCESKTLQGVGYCGKCKSMHRYRSDMTQWERQRDQKDAHCHYYYTTKQTNKKSPSWPPVNLDSLSQWYCWFIFLAPAERHARLEKIMMYFLWSWNLDKAFHSFIYPKHGLRYVYISQQRYQSGSAAMLCKEQLRG